jgi:serine protease AprX
MRERKLLGPGYQHVDGTSFAAPIVAGVVAQMLDANADLKPAAVKHILLATAERLRGADLYRQGFGMLNARRAVEEARRAPGGLPDAYFRGPHREGDAMIFYYLDAAATSVALAGEFNGWNTHATLFDREPNGLWKVAIPCPRPGPFRYKLVVDGGRWIEDPNALLKEADPVGGFRSVVVVPDGS